MAFQNLWEKLRKKGENLSKYPYDEVVSFVFRYYPKLKKERKKVRILDVGCGMGNNMWFAAREGFQVYGIDGSETAINSGKKFFNKMGLKGKFFCGDFMNLPFEDEFFDIIIDRCSITCNTFEDTVRIFEEIYRVLKPEGYFYFNPYSVKNSSYNPQIKEKYQNTVKGPIKGSGYVCFYDIQDIHKLTKGNRWKICEFISVEKKDLINPEFCLSYYIVILKKR